MWGSTGSCLNGYETTVSDSRMIAGVEEKVGCDDLESWRHGVVTK